MLARETAASEGSAYAELTWVHGDDSSPAVVVRERPDGYMLALPGNLSIEGPLGALGVATPVSTFRRAVPVRSVDDPRREDGRQVFIQLVDVEAAWGLELRPAEDGDGYPTVDGSWGWPHGAGLVAASTVWIASSTGGGGAVTMPLSEYESLASEVTSPRPARGPGRADALLAPRGAGGAAGSATVPSGGGSGALRAVVPPGAPPPAATRLGGRRKAPAAAESEELLRDLLNELGATRDQLASFGARLTRIEADHPPPRRGSRPSADGARFSDVGAARARPMAAAVTPAAPAGGLVPKAGATAIPVRPGGADAWGPVLGFAARPPPRLRDPAVGADGAPDDEDEVEEWDEELPAAGTDPGSPDGELLRALASQSAALERLLRRDETRADPLLGDQGLSQSTSSGVRGALAREAMLEQLVSHPGRFSARVRGNMVRALGAVQAPGGVVDPLLFYERFGAFGESAARPYGYVSWALAHILQALWRNENERAADVAALLAVALEQVVLDSGRWDVAWVMSLLEEPPLPMMERPPQRTGIRTFPRTADQAWATAALAYIRELDTITTRRRELQSQPRGPRAPKKEPAVKEEGAPPKQPRRPRGRGGRGGGAGDHPE